MSLNMKQEIRRELRFLKKQSRAIEHAFGLDISDAIKKKRAAEKTIDRMIRLRSKHQKKTARRILILEGRLA